jgi:hypothetical protein
MQLDIRLPIGALFTLIGLLLLLQGALDSLDVDVAWGTVMVLFGATMLLLGLKSRRR